MQDHRYRQLTTEIRKADLFKEKYSNRRSYLPLPFKLAHSLIHKTRSKNIEKRCVTGFSVTRCFARGDPDECRLSDVVDYLARVLQTGNCRCRLIPGKCPGIYVVPLSSGGAIACCALSASEEITHEGNHFHI